MKIFSFQQEHTSSRRNNLFAKTKRMIARRPFRGKQQARTYAEAPAGMPLPSTQELMVPLLGGILMFLLTLLLQFIKLKTFRKHHRKTLKWQQRAVLSTISEASIEDESRDNSYHQELHDNDSMYQESNKSDDSFSIESSSSSDDTEAPIDPEDENSCGEGDETHYYTWTRNTSKVSSKDRDASLKSTNVLRSLLSTDSMYTGALLVSAVAVTSVIAATTHRKR